MNTTTAHSSPTAAPASPGDGRALAAPIATSADERMAQAVARIEASRGALIRCLSPDEPTPRRDPAQTSDRSGNTAVGASWVESLMARIERNGLLQGSWRTLRALSRRWWKRQPWHGTVDLVGQTLVHQTQPIIRRHPLASLAVAAALGAGVTAALSAARPWAWQRVQHQAGPWRDRLSSLLWTQLTATPVQMALAGALAAWLADRTNTGAQPSGHPSTGHSADPATPDREGSGPKAIPG
jgi:hypothetical protein